MPCPAPTGGTRRGAGTHEGGPVPRAAAGADDYGRAAPTMPWYQMGS